MSTVDDPMNVFECSTCGNIGLGSREITCCEEPMQAVSEDDLVIDSPTLKQLLRSVFDISETELTVCLCVMEAGETTVKELAEEIGYDRSVISRHLNDLVELDVLYKQRRLLDQGGQVYVYTPADPETVRRSFRRQFLAWVREGAVLIDELRREKIEAIVESDEEDADWKIFREQ
ncbi:MAG: ArsR family transcriptional regulator [Halobacteriales archaeon]